MHLLVVLVAYCLAEAAWLLSMRPFYAARFASIARDGRLGVRSWPAVALIYPILLAAAYVLVLRPCGNPRESNWRTAVARGALFGGCVYGVYNLTNMATLPGYSWGLVAVDTAWGAALFGGVAVLSLV